MTHYSHFGLPFGCQVGPSQVVAHASPIELIFLKFLLLGGQWDTESFEVGGIGKGKALKRGSG